MLLRDLDEVSSLRWVDVGCVIVFDEEGSKEIGHQKEEKGHKGHWAGRKENKGYESMAAFQDDQSSQIAGHEGVF